MENINILLPELARYLNLYTQLKFDNIQNFTSYKSRWSNSHWKRGYNNNNIITPQFETNLLKIINDELVVILGVTEARSKFFTSLNQIDDLRLENKAVYFTIEEGFIGYDLFVTLHQSVFDNELN